MSNIDKFTAVRKAQKILIEVSQTDTGTGDYLETEAAYALQALNEAFGEYGEDEEENEDE
jgi:hypothetical protein